MSLVRAQRKVTTAPKTVVSCLRALGVEVRSAPSFWVEHHAELDWLIKDAHRAWRQRLIASHPDYNGTHEEASYWNAVWAQVEKAFRWHGVTLGGRAIVPLCEVPIPAGARPIKTAEERREHRAEYDRTYRRTNYRLKVGIPLSAPRNSWYARQPVARAVLLLISIFGLSFSVFADGPDLYQHVWRSNRTLFASVDVPACHVARWERRFLDVSTNWFSAMTVDEDVSTRRVVFSESIGTSNVVCYRIHVLRVLTCADITLTVSACAKLYD